MTIVSSTTARSTGDAMRSFRSATRRTKRGVVGAGDMPHERMAFFPGSGHAVLQQGPLSGHAQSIGAAAMSGTIASAMHAISIATSTAAETQRKDFVIHQLYRNINIE